MAKSSPLQCAATTTTSTFPSCESSKELTVISNWPFVFLCDIPAGGRSAVARGKLMPRLVQLPGESYL